MDLQDFKDEVSRMAVGMTKKEAHDQGICIKCKLPWEPRTHSDAGRREYQISGYCEECFDDLFTEGE